MVMKRININEDLVCIQCYMNLLMINALCILGILNATFVLINYFYYLLYNITLHDVYQ